MVFSTMAVLGGPVDDPLGVNGTLATGISGNNIVGNYADRLWQS